MNKNGLTSMALAAALAASASPAVAQTAPQPVTIGVIDTKANDIERPGVTVTYRHFGVEGHREGVEQINRKRTHGDVAIDSIAEAREKMGDQRPYKVLAANPFVETQSGGLAVNYKGLREAVAWFKESGVRVIATSFATKDNTPGMMAFNQAAKDAGMTVVASVGNDGMTTVPFPAAYPEVIAIDGYHYAQKGDVRYHAPFMNRADAVFDGGTAQMFHPDGIDRKNDGQPYESTAPDRAKQVRGSSFAASKAAAFLAANLGEGATPDESRKLLQSVYVQKGVPVRLAMVVQPGMAIASAAEPVRKSPAAPSMMRPAAFAAIAGGPSR